MNCKKLNITNDFFYNFAGVKENPDENNVFM